MPSWSSSRLHSYLRLSANPRGFFEVERQFVLVDTQKSRLASLNQVSTTFGLCGIKLRNDELEAVFRQVANGQAQVNYLELISTLRGQMTAKREGAVLALFRDMDPKNSGVVQAQALLDWFRADKHPDVLERHAVPEAIYSDFADKLDLFGKLGVE